MATLHSAPGLELLWQASLYAVIALPAAWYGVVSRYAGFWSTPMSALRRRHTPVAVLAGGLLALLLAMMALGRALPTLNQAITLDVSPPDRAGQIALFGLTYPIYGLLSMGAALDALSGPARHPRHGDAGPAPRAAVAAVASVLLLLVSLVASFGLQAATQSISRVGILRVGLRPI